jgi:hypothetical protein
MNVECVAFWTDGKILLLLEKKELKAVWGAPISIFFFPSTGSGKAE